MLMNLMNYVSSKVKNEEGQGMVEYALIIGLIAVIVVVALGPLGTAIAKKFTDITASL
ncbi:MAG TPA: Flp family type IVb pilin [Clostridium sp.]|uniref:Flp family type IVb pilin n=1 Tax=Clostridium sp. TaxID=1506 RepID=UPI002F9253CF